MEILNFEEACEFLKVSAPSLYRYVRNGKIPAFKMGKSWKFSKEALDAWVRERVQQDTKSREERKV